MRRAARPDTRFVRAIGSTDRCLLAIRAFRLLLEPGPRTVTTVALARQRRLHAKLAAAVDRFTPAERAYYEDQIGLLAYRERDWRLRMSETPEQLPTDPREPGRPDVGPPGPARPEVDPHPGRGPERGPKPDNTLPGPERPTPKR